MTLSYVLYAFIVAFQVAIGTLILLAATLITLDILSYIGGKIREHQDD